MVDRYRRTRHPDRMGHRWRERNDIKMLLPTLDDVARSGLLDEIETLHLDRGYDYPKIRAQLADRGLDDFDIQLRATGASSRSKQPLRLGLRWVVEGTNSG